MSAPLASTPALNAAELARVVAAAPHRLLFFGGATAVLLSMSWWALVLVGQRSGVLAMPLPLLPAGWAHAIGMQYQALPMFMFGFLLTVFPRWMGLKAYTRWHYLPAALGRRVLASGLARGLVGRLAGSGRIVRTTSLRGYLQLFAVSRLRPWRRASPPRCARKSAGPR